MSDGQRVLEESTWNDEEQQWTHRCGAIVLGAKVYHSIYDSPLPLTGSGQVHVEMVPYCPACDTPPRQAGTPIRTVPLIR
jgi:hypothetical protein